MTGLILSLQGTKRGYRLAVGILFFLQGLCFASWASRIPSIQQQLNLGDAALGAVLFALPVGSFIALPFAGWLVTKFGSKRTATNALLLYSLMLITIGLANSVFLLIMSLVIFGMAGNTANIAINTQAVGVEEKYGRNIMASFHGLWSLAGFSAAGIGAFMLARNIVPLNHFLIITALILGGVAASFNFLLPDTKKNTGPTPIFVKPDRSLMKLGFIAFCCMICEGAMFDWSGIYFRKVVHADIDWIGAGYTAFMCTMATGRFVADRIVSRFGFKTTIRTSGVLIATGLSIAVIFPFLVSSIIGFLIVGFGVSSVIPLIYSEAGKSKLVSPGMALAAVSSIGFIGFLIGPPLIGIVAGIFSLRISFLIIAIIGIMVAVMVGSGKSRHQKVLQNDLQSPIL
jgi:MFS family permease